MNNLNQKVNPKDLAGNTEEDKEGEDWTAVPHLDHISEIRTLDKT